MNIIFWISVFLIIYTYIIYPAFLFLLSRLKKPLQKETSPQIFPQVSIIIAALNEEKHIEARIENCLKLKYPKDKFNIIIASDGSTDGTVQIAQSFENDQVIVLDRKERQGKVNVLNDIVPNAEGEIIVFSDANTFFDDDALIKLVQPFSDPTIGSVCGRLKFTTAEGSNSGELEGFYWKFETFLKTIEGQFGSVLGANGAIFAIRKELFFQCPADTIIEDFVVPMKILEKGYHVVYEPHAIAREEAAKNMIQEKQRRIRIGAGDYQALTLLKGMLCPLRGFPALAFWSHKVIRWMVPFCMIIAFISNIFLMHTNIYSIILGFQFSFYLCALIGQLLTWTGIRIKLFNLCYYFISMNMALFLGFISFIMRTHSVKWTRTER